MAVIERRDINLVIAIFLGSLIALQAWSIRDAGLYANSWGATPTGQEDHAALATSIFDTWAVPFEVLSILLLVGLVGAIAVAMRMPDEEGGEE